MKLKLLTWGAGPDLEMEWWRSGESLTGVAQGVLSGVAFTAASGGESSTSLVFRVVLLFFSHVGLGDRTSLRLVGFIEPTHKPTLILVHP